MHYKIGINDLQIPVRTGVRSHERETPQPVVMDATLWIASTGDLHLDDNIPSYSTIRTALIAVAQSSHTPLLEELAVKMGTACLAHKGVKFAVLRLTKPRALPDAQVYVEMSFGKKPSEES